MSALVMSIPIYIICRLKKKNNNNKTIQKNG